MKLTISTFIVLFTGASAFITNRSPPAFRPIKTTTTTTTGRLHVASSSSESNTKTKVAPVFDEVCETTGVTLKRFMTEVTILNPELRELTTLFGAIDTACKAISNLVKRSQLPSSQTLGYQGEVNIQGEDQKKLDVITNDLLKRALRFTGRLGVLASEEEDTPVSLSCRKQLLCCCHRLTGAIFPYSLLVFKTLSRLYSIYFYERSFFVGRSDGRKGSSVR